MTRLISTTVPAGCRNVKSLSSAPTDADTTFSIPANSTVVPDSITLTSVKSLIPVNVTAILLLIVTVPVDKLLKDGESTPPNTFNIKLPVPPVGLNNTADPVADPDTNPVNRFDWKLYSPAVVISTPWLLPLPANVQKVTNEGSSDTRELLFAMAVSSEGGAGGTTTNCWGGVTNVESNIVEPL